MSPTEGCVEVKLVEKDANGATDVQRLLHDLQEALREVEELRRRNMEMALNLASRAIENASESIMITDCNGVILLVNPAFERATGYAERELVGYKPAVLKSGRHDKAFYRELWASLKRNGQWQGEIWNRHKSGETCLEWLNISAVKADRKRVTHYVGIYTDIGRQEYTLERLHYLAYYDALTGLPNRRLFLDRLNVALAQARHDGRLVAVMFVDLDHFKNINDRFGHLIGDKLLTITAERLKSCLRKGDTISRLGGDEFTVILPALSHPGDAAKVALKFLQSYAEPVNLDGVELQVSGSIGISLYPDDDEDPEALLNKADLAMYQVKEAGRNCYQFYGNVPDS